jgi:hypothetical protein
MSDTSNPYTPQWQQPTQSAGATDVVTQLQNIVRQLTALVKATNSVATALANRAVLGVFTATAGTTSVISQPAVQSQSTVTLTPTNSAAATLVKTDGYFITTSVGTGFTVTFGGSAVGTETFNYLVSTPT